MTGQVTTEVPIVTVVPVATTRHLPHVRVAGVAGGPIRLSRHPGRARSGRGLGGRHVTLVT
ncbi:hypothetical protein Taro_019334 [Colocasia esculenta]|uniref:Uncharacterized protein n=1 Tax=Colocasia esculenta TaxID=4460 RepID=A0A843UTI8_COLES|nr:hypothetical protein [Colocasia esculenta]